MNDRYCVFVDAGYLYAAGGHACLGLGDRSSMLLDVESFVPALSAYCNNHALDGRGRWLRTYWYDGAVRGIPHGVHEAIGLLPRVKIRIGRLVEQEQKGVDSLIVRDLVILAERQAISTAFLLGGDEDLREGVREAQDRGVEVVLLGIEPPKGSNLSDTLVMEADQLLLVGEEMLRPHFSKPDFAGVATPASSPFELGRQFAMAYVGSLERFERRAVLRSGSWLPRYIDWELRRRIGAMANRQDSNAINQARRGFRDGCDSLRVTEQGGPSS